MVRLHFTWTYEAAAQDSAAAQGRTAALIWAAAMEVIAAPDEYRPLTYFACSFHTPAGQLSSRILRIAMVILFRKNRCLALLPDMKALISIFQVKFDHPNTK